MTLAERALQAGYPEHPTYVLMGMIYEEEGYLAKALYSYRKAIEQSAHFRPWMTRCYNGMASILTSYGRYDSVEYYLNRSLKLDSTRAGLVRYFQAKAKYLQARNKYDEALNALHNALENCEETDKRNTAVILSSIGSVSFTHIPDKSIAERHFLESNKVLDSAIHYNILARNYGRLANVAMNLGDGTKARKWLERATTIINLSNNLPVRAYILSSWAILFFGDGKFTEGLDSQKESIAIKRQLGGSRSLQNDLLNIGETYIKLKMYSEAEAALNEGKSISKDLNDLVYLKYFYEQNAALDSVRGDYKGAYRNYKIAIKYKDSTFSAQHLRDVREIQEKYETEQNKKVIAEKERELEHQKYRQAVAISVTSSIVMISIIVLISLQARNKKQQNTLRLQAIVKTQEEVQQRIARDLHDGLVQVLGAAKMSLQSISPNSDIDTLKKHIRNASDIIDEAVTEARSISHEVLPYSLIKDGLISALDELFARGLPSYEFKHEETFSAKELIVINIYRIAQELVNNVQKHAISSHVVISLRSPGQNIYFDFADNGHGFDMTTEMSGAGLRNIKTRAELIGGSVIIMSALYKGTKIELSVPK